MEDAEPPGDVGPFHVDTLSQLSRSSVEACPHASGAGRPMPAESPQGCQLDVVDMRLKPGAQVILLSQLTSTVNAPTKLRIQFDAELITLEPKPQGWNAVLAIGEAPMDAIQAFGRLVNEFAQSDGRVFVSPISSPPIGEDTLRRDSDAVCWLHALVRPLAL